LPGDAGSGFGLGRGGLPSEDKVEITGECEIAFLRVEDAGRIPAGNILAGILLPPSIHDVGLRTL
jgi:hypothetical protein